MCYSRLSICFLRSTFSIGSGDRECGLLGSCAPRRPPPEFAGLLQLSCRHNPAGCRRAGKDTSASSHAMWGGGGRATVLSGTRTQHSAVSTKDYQAIYGRLDGLVCVLDPAHNGAREVTVITKQNKRRSDRTAPDARAGRPLPSSRAAAAPTIPFPKLCQTRGKRRGPSKPPAHSWPGSSRAVRRLQVPRKN